MDLSRILMVGIGGFLGSIARYATVRAVDVRFNHAFPFGTIAVNIAGCFILGVIVGVTGRAVNGEAWRAFLGVGFCGGFTTFSAFALENQNLLAERMIGASAMYIVASVVLGILAMFLGLWCARFL